MLLKGKLYQNNANAMQNAPGKVSFAFDAWSSKTMLPFLGITAHYIDNNWTIRRQLLSFEHFLSPYTGKRLADTLFKALSEKDLLEKFMCLSGDSASSNIEGKRL